MGFFGSHRGWGSILLPRPKGHEMNGTRLRSALRLVTYSDSQNTYQRPPSAPMSSPARASFSSGRFHHPSSSSNPSSWTNPPLRIPQVPPRSTASPSETANESSISVGERLPVPSSSVQQSNLSASLAGQAPQLSPGTITPVSGFNLPGPFSPSPTSERPGFSLDAVPDEDKLKILGKHLVSAQERRQSRSGTPDMSSMMSLRTGLAIGGESGVASVVGSDTGNNSVDENENEFSIPYESQGGDVT